MIYPWKKQGESLAELNLSIKTTNALEAAGVHEVQQLLEYEVGQLLDLLNSATMVGEIIFKLTDLGYKIKGI